MSTWIGATQTPARWALEAQGDELFITLRRAAESQLENLFSILHLVDADRRATLLAAVEHEFNHRAQALRPDPLPSVGSD